jgi:pimeloyl-ACP methyl ester carboxylesterase
MVTVPYADLNAIQLYYEIQGAGEPLVIIPGGLMTAAMMGPLVQPLADARQIIAIETQAHGHTLDVDRPLGFEQMADDSAALIAQLGL